MVIFNGYVKLPEGIHMMLSLDYRQHKPSWQYKNMGRERKGTAVEPFTNLLLMYIDVYVC